MRSDCPLNFALEMLGDKWSLLVIRDMVFFNKRYYNEFLASDECISTNVLATRLDMLEEEGLITKHNDPKHKQKIIYRLTQKSIDLLPVIVEIALWSDKYGGLSVHKKASALLGDIAAGKRAGIQRLKQALIKEHLRPQVP